MKLNSGLVCEAAKEIRIQRDFVMRDFCLPQTKKYAKKVISSTFQTNINLHMFRDEFEVKKRGLVRELGF